MKTPKCYTWLESCGSHLSGDIKEKIFFCILQSVRFSMTVRTDIFLYTEKLSYTAAVQAGKLSPRPEMFSSTVSTGWRQHSPREALTTAMDALQHSLYRPETTSPTGSSQHRSREALTSPSLSSVYPVLLLPSVNLNPSIGFIYYLESTVVPKNKPTSGSGDLSPTLGEEVCAPLWFKTSVLLAFLNSQQCNTVLVNVATKSLVSPQLDLATIAHHQGV